MRIKIILVYLILQNISCFPQNKISVILSGGTSNLHEINNEKVIQRANHYSQISSFKVGVYHDFYKKDSLRAFPTIGMTITAKGAKNNLPDGMVWYGTNKSYKIERFFSLDLPILLNYRFEKWLTFKGGINTSLLFSASVSQGDHEKRICTFGLIGGASINIKRYSVFTEYIYDLTNMLKFSNMDISYRNSLLHIGIGYYF